MKNKTDTKVMKFGGSSVEHAPQMLNVLNIVKNTINEKKQIIVVLSACKGITDKLNKVAELAVNRNTSLLTDSTTHQLDIFYTIKLHHLSLIESLLTSNKHLAVKKVNSLLDELNNLLDGVAFLKELTKSTLDAILSFGELLSTTIFQYLCLDNGIENSFIDARDIIFTDNNYNSAELLFDETESNINTKIKSLNCDLIITQGFIASYNQSNIKKTTTLGRGGSDYSAAVIGAAVNAKEIEIWTDVDGILSADPRICHNATTIGQMSFNEVKDLSFWGAKVIHPKSILPAIERNITVKVLNSFNCTNSGTVINSSDYGNFFSINSVAVKTNCVLFYSNNTDFISKCAFDILYYGYSNGSYISLLDIDLIIDRSYILSEGNNIFCTAICITGANLQSYTSELGMFLSKVLSCLFDVKLYQVINGFSGNSIILVIAPTEDINIIIQRIHDIILSY